MESYLAYACHSTSRGRIYLTSRLWFRATDTVAPAQAFATRMTAIEQARSRRIDVHQQVPTTTEDLSWIEYHKIHEQRLAEGERALAALARTAADTSNEPDFHPDLHPPLEEGHDTPYADRSGPRSRFFEFQRRSTGASNSSRRPWVGANSTK